MIVIVTINNPVCFTDFVLPFTSFHLRIIVQKAAAPVVKIQLIDVTCMI